VKLLLKDCLRHQAFFQNQIVKNAYLGSQWIGSPRGQIDQLKEVKAAEKRVSIGISTLAEETAILTGGDWDRKYPQILKEYYLKKKAGIINDDNQNDTELTNNNKNHE